jgi:hypothetical protein
VRTLPTTMIQALASKRLWSHVQVLLAGTILAPGKRTVTSALRAVGLEEERQFCRYHRVLNRVAWSIQMQPARVFRTGARACMLAKVQS